MMKYTVHIAVSTFFSIVCGTGSLAQPLPPPLKEFVKNHTMPFNTDFFSKRHKVLIYSIKGSMIRDSLDAQSIENRIGETPERRKFGNFQVVFTDSLNNEIEKFTIPNPLYTRIEAEGEVSYRRVTGGHFEIALPSNFKQIAYVTLRYYGMPTIRSDVRQLFKNL